MKVWVNFLGVQNCIVGDEKCFESVEILRCGKLQKCCLIEFFTIPSCKLILIPFDNYQLILISKWKPIIKQILPKVCEGP